VDVALDESARIPAPAVGVESASHDHGVDAVESLHLFGGGRLDLETLSCQRISQHPPYPFGPATLRAPRDQYSHELPSMDVPSIEGENLQESGQNCPRFRS
jgi:hypothetical protein